MPLAEPMPPCEWTCDADRIASDVVRNRRGPAEPFELSEQVMRRYHYISQVTESARNVKYHYAAAPALRLTENIVIKEVSSERGTR